MDLLNKLENRERRDIVRFHKAHMHDENVDEVHEMKWTAEAMELVGKTKLPSNEKKKLVTELHKDLVQNPKNNFKDSFNIAGAIEFVWDTDHQRYGIRVHKKGFLEKCMPCCASCTVAYDVDDRQLHLDAEPLPMSEKENQDSDSEVVEGSQLFERKDLDVDDKDMIDDKDTVITDEDTVITDDRDVVSQDNDNIKDDDVNVHIHLAKDDQGQTVKIQTPVKTSAETDTAAVASP